jgi:hypothetical protein
VLSAEILRTGRRRAVGVLISDLSIFSPSAGLAVELSFSRARPMHLGNAAGARRGARAWARTPKPAKAGPRRGRGRPDELHFFLTPVLFGLM